MKSFAYFRFLSFLYTDLTSKSGFWAKALSERHAVHDGLLFFYVDAGGDVHYGLNGESKGVFMQGIDTRSPLWVLLDIYGNSTIVEFLDCRPQLNNNRMTRRYVFIVIYIIYRLWFSGGCSYSGFDRDFWSWGGGGRMSHPSHSFQLIFLYSTYTNITKVPTNRLKSGGSGGGLKFRQKRPAKYSIIIEI